MKNEPIVAYNHLQEDENEKSSSSHSQEEHHYEWKAFVHPLAIVIEIAAIIGMAFFMIEEMFY